MLFRSPKRAFMSIEDSTAFLAAASSAASLFARIARFGGGEDMCRNDTGLVPRKASVRPPSEFLKERAEDRRKSAMRSTRRMYNKRSLARTTLVLLIHYYHVRRRLIDDYCSGTKE